MDLWLWHYRNVVLRDELAERLAAGATAVECAVFAAGSLAGFARDVDEAATATAGMVGALRDATSPPGGTPWEKAHGIRARRRAEVLRAASGHDEEEHRAHDGL